MRCRIVDELGLAHQKVGEFDRARENFELVLLERKQREDPVDVCQSLVNLVRLDVAMGDLDSARSHADEALSGATRGSPSSALHANAEVLHAQVLLRQGKAAEALENVAWAISINRQIGNRRGEAIALLVSAQCHRAAGNVLEAIGYAEQALELNRSMGNEYGEGRARWLLDLSDALASIRGASPRNPPGGPKVIVMAKSMRSNARSKNRIRYRNISRTLADCGLIADRNVGRKFGSATDRPPMVCVRQ